jgi:hypothetical protein
MCPNSAFACQKERISSAFSGMIASGVLKNKLRCVRIS